MKKVVELNRRGFTLIEVIVVAAIIAILAGILVPMIFSQIDESRISKAKGDVKAIQGATMVFRKDTGKWPNFINSTPTGNTITFLTSAAGAVPAIDPGATDWTQTTTDIIEKHLNIDDSGAYGTTWKGSYLPTAGKDPWDNAYVINADAFNAANPVWIMSAGPDGIIQTPSTNTESIGDDIGIRIK